MIAAFVAALLIAQAGTPSAPPDVPPLRDLITPDQVLVRYASALAKLPAPRVVAFDYEVAQTGARDLLQTHRIFRSGGDQRDELLTVDGHKLEPAPIRVVHGRRDRYAVGVIAPRPGAYDFHYIGAKQDGRHKDFVFATAPHTPGKFRITQVTIDGSTFLPHAIAFATDVHAGSGTIVYARAGTYWMPTVASARAMYATSSSREKIVFTNYQFPASFPPGTFAKPRVLVPPG